MTRARGFTLIEVMVAMFVIALGIGALLSALVSSANTVNYLRDKSFAQWIAFNQLSELRLNATTAPAAGVTSDVVEYAGGVWRWEQQVSAAGIGDLWRVSVRVSRLGDIGSTVARRAEGVGVDDPDEQADRPALGNAIGFLPSTVTRPSGLTPDWSPTAPTGPGPGGGGDGGASGGGGGGDNAGGSG